MGLESLIIINIARPPMVSGVDRYLEMLTYSTKEICNTLWISLVHNAEHLGVEVIIDGSVKHILLPFPDMPYMIIGEFHCMKAYTNEVMKYIQPHLEDHSCRAVIHIHTLNLIELALSLKGILPNSKVITHLHCIPWKGYINSNIHLFNQLYRKYYLEADWDTHQFLTNHSELDAYTKADSIVCLTDSARDFISHICPNVQSKVRLIPNGIIDLSFGFNRDYRDREEIRMVYVGALSRGKGLTYILEALRKAQDFGLSISLDVAGYPPPNLERLIREKYLGLKVVLRGMLEKEELMNLYKEAHIGIIASLQEQCSYVAIEMAMMSLPIITTAVDGLDEIFEDEVNALKVPVIFSRAKGLLPDVDYMAQCIARLAKDKILREKLGVNARALYLRYYTLDRMMQDTKKLYSDILDEHTL